MAYHNSSAVTIGLNQSNYYHSRYEFIVNSPGLAISAIILLAMASFVGTCGNIVILVIIAKTKELRRKQSIFIVNLALSDMYVTMIADPMSLVGKIEGSSFFDDNATLCMVVGKLCTISCISSLGSIACLSFNRYVCICHNSYYNKIFSRRNSIGMCASLYAVGLLLVMMNSVGIGGHGFDDKSLECIWDRMATYSYTVVFSVCLVWIPVIVVGVSYLSLFLHVRKKRNEIQNINVSNQSKSKPLKLAKTIFIIYTTFSLCWIPFAILLVADVNDTFSSELHLCITVIAHLHPSINWLIYFMTNSNFNTACKKLFHRNYNQIIQGPLTSTAADGVVSANQPRDLSIDERINKNVVPAAKGITSSMQKLSSVV